MSALGRIAREFWTGQTGYAAAIPGGIHPDIAPVGTTMPYVVYTGVSRTAVGLLNGTTTAQTERVQFTVCSMSRSEAQVAAKWLGDRIRSSPGRQSVGTATIFQWNIEDETGSAEVLGDGSDEAVRTVDVDLIGTFKEA